MLALTLTLSPWERVPQTRILRFGRLNHPLTRSRGGGSTLSPTGGEGRVRGQRTTGGSMGWEQPPVAADDPMGYPSSAALFFSEQTADEPQRSRTIRKADERFTLSPGVRAS